MTGKANALPMFLNSCLLESCKQQSSDPLPLKIRMDGQTLDDNEATFWRIGTHFAEKVILQISSWNSRPNNIAHQLTMQLCQQKSIRDAFNPLFDNFCTDCFCCWRIQLLDCKNFFQSLNSACLIRIGASIQSPPTERCWSDWTRDVQRNIHRSGCPQLP